jgi:hypothetical protein
MELISPTEIVKQKVLAVQEYTSWRSTCRQPDAQAAVFRDMVAGGSDGVGSLPLLC